MRTVYLDESILADIADSIRGKLGTDSVFYPREMANAILEIQTGKKVTTGTVTFATEQANPVIIHNLGSKPIFFGIYVIDETAIPESGTSEAKGCIWKGYAIYLQIEDRVAFANIYANQGNTSTGVYSWQPMGNPSNGITETTIKLGGSNTNYRYQSNHEYAWIAIG